MAKRIGIMLPMEHFDDIVYSAREAQIRFTRLRKAVRRGDPDVSHWTEEECEEKMDKYADVETLLKDLYRNATGEEW